MESGNRSTSSSFSQSRYPPRRHKFASNATHQSKVSSFSQRVTPPPTTGSHSNAPTSDFNDDDSSFGVLLGTCSYMCPGKLIYYFFVIYCIV